MDNLHHFIFPQHEAEYKRIAAVVEDMADEAIVAAVKAEAMKQGVTDLYMLDRKFVIDALKEKIEREKPKPLTIEQLQTMNGEPVWLEDEKVWGIINIDDCGQWKGIPFITFYWRGIRCDWNIVRRKLTCYRCKPKGEHHG